MTKTIESGPEWLARKAMEKEVGTIEAKVVTKRLSPKDSKKAKEDLIVKAEASGIELSPNKSLSDMTKQYEKELINE